MSKEMNMLEQAEKALKNSAASSGPSNDLIRHTLEQIEQTNKKTLLKRILKMKPLTKYAAAAILLVGLSAIFLFPTGRQSIALASVYTKVQQAQAYVYQMSMTMIGMEKMMGSPDRGGPMEMDVTITFSEEYGMKMENHMKAQGPNGQTQNITQYAYLLPEEKVMLSIMPEQKMYQRIEFTDDLLEQTKKQNNDPREMIKQMMECEYIELEPTEIDGIKVQGFQTTDPAYTLGVAKDVTATLWVDVNTWLPIRSEVSAKIGEMEVTYSLDRFEWNVPVTATDFEFIIPDNYKEQGSMKMPEMTQDAAIDGLRNYVKLFGQYPERIDMASLIPSLTKNLRALKDTPQTEYAKEFVAKMETAGDDRTKIQGFVQEFTMPIQALAMFHMKLAQDKKEPMYYGNQVTPEDVDAVLMRWKDDSGKYTVVFGDLTVAEMEYEELTDIEPQPESETP